MKSLNHFRPAMKALAMTMVVGAMFFLASCDEKDPVFPAPTVTVGTTTAQGLANAKVTTAVTIDSPAGGKTLNILVAGPSAPTIPSVALDGTESQTVNVEFTIPATAVAGNIYVLTFQAIDNKDQNSTVGLLTVTVSSVPSKTIVDVSADITTNTTWTKDKIYKLTKIINVGTDTKDVAGNGNLPTVKTTAILTIEAGTVIYGASGTPGGGLVIHRGSKIIAEGTAALPIVFTSAKAPGSRQAGDWAGLVLCGKATNNTKTSLSTGAVGVDELEGGYGAFHGDGANSNDADNSGSLKYVRVEFAGYPINPNQEINGITFGSVGSATTVDYVQVSYSNDDSFEWFGGKVKAKHLISYKAIDDDFDTDFGFQGIVQYGLALRDNNFADQSGSNGFESDNNGAGNSDTPLTDATFANMTIIGGKQLSNTSLNIQFQNGAQIRRNSRIDILNSFITGFPNGIYIDNALPGSVAAAEAGDLKLKKNILAGVEGWGGNGFGTAATADEQAALGVAAGANHGVAPRGFSFVSGVGAFSAGVFAVTTPATISTKAGITWFTDASANKAYSKWNHTDLKLSGNMWDPASNGGASFSPAAGSTMLTFGADNLAGLTGVDDVDYVGAFDTGASADWTASWANWSPQNKDYSVQN